MISKIITAGIVLSSMVCRAQNVSSEYTAWLKKADSLYFAGDFKNSALSYSAAFKSVGWKGTTNDRYNAACCWALASVPDSAFFYLERIAKLHDYRDHAHLLSDEDLKSLHGDKRWKPLTTKVKKNQEKAEAKLDKALVAKLKAVHENDQALRMKIQELEKSEGPGSEKIKEVWEQIHTNDSVNLVEVKTILDEYGWLGADVVGDEGNRTLFLVIQHADLKTQETYLPMMRDAVKQGRAQASSLALLEDRIEIRNGRKQIYGSQIGMDKDHKNYVSPLIDPDHVDERRASVGLQPLSDYLKFWNMTWDVELYKKDLPRLEAIQKKY